MSAGARPMHSQLCRRAERGRFPVWIVSKNLKETLMGIAVWIIIILIIAALIKYLLSDSNKK